MRRKRDNLKDGDLVRLPIPLRFSDGASRDEFRAEHHQRRGQTKLYFRSPDGLLCRLTAKQFAVAEVNPPPRAPVADAAETKLTRRAEGLTDQADALRAGKHGVIAFTGALSDVARDDGVWRGKLRLDDLQGVIGVRFVRPVFQNPEQFAGARVTVYCGPPLPERPLEVDALLIEEAEPRLDADLTGQEAMLQEELDLGSGEAPSL